MGKTEKLKFDKFEVEINPESLRFDEQSLSSYIQTEAGYYDNFGAFLALAERNLQNKEVAHERLFSERFVESKESGSSDKLAEASAKADQDVVSLKEDIIEARYVVNRLKNHLKAWDKNHDNAQSMGHMLRRLMDRLKDDIYGPTDSRVSDFDRTISDTVGTYDQGVSSFEDSLSLENLF